jgi:hypothetical protein
MAKTKKENTSILQNDVDDSHSTAKVNEAVEFEQAQNDAVLPKEGTNTSSFKLTLISFGVSLISLVLTLAVSLGYIGVDMANNVRETVSQFGLLMTGLFAAGSAAVGTMFVHGRNQVSQIKAKAAANLALAQANASQVGESGMVQGGVLRDSSPLGAFGMNPMAMATMGINMALMFLGNPKAGTKKAAVVKALRAALAAIQSVQSEE